MDESGAILGSTLDVHTPTPYSLRLASLARKRPRTTEEQFTTSFSCEVCATPDTPLGPEDLPETFLMINVPQEVPGMAITGFSVDVLTGDSATEDALRRSLLFDNAVAGVVVDVTMQTMDKVGRAVPGEAPVVVASFGNRCAAPGCLPPATNAAYDGSSQNIPIPPGQHVMISAHVRTPAGGEGDSQSSAVVSGCKIVLNVFGYVVLPPSDEGDNCGVSTRGQSMTSCPRREARKFINKVHQRSNVSLSPDATLKVQLVLSKAMAAMKAPTLETLNSSLSVSSEIQSSNQVSSKALGGGDETKSSIKNLLPKRRAGPTASSSPKEARKSAMSGTSTPKKKSS